MSVIFKTLEKLKNDTLNNNAGKEKARKRKNIISFDDVVSSLPGLLLAGLIIICF